MSNGDSNPYRALVNPYSGMTTDSQGLVGKIVAPQLETTASGQELLPQGDTSWGPTQEFGSKVLFGAGPYVQAAGEAVKKALPKSISQWIFDPGAPEAEYQTALDAARAHQGQFRQEHPYQATAANIAGAVPAAVAATAFAPESLLASSLYYGATNAGLNLTQRAIEEGEQRDPWRLGADFLVGMAGVPLSKIAAASGYGVVPRAIGGVGVGGGAGTLYGYLTGAKPEDLPLYALGGAGIGAGTTTAPQFLTKGAQNISNLIFNKLFNTSPRGADSVIETLASGGHTPETAQQAVQDLGAGATLADTSPAAQTQTAALAASPEQANLVKGNLEGRAGQFVPEAQAALERAIGPDFNEVQYLNDLKATTKAQGEAGYRPVLSQPIAVNASDVATPIDAAKAAAQASKASQGDIAGALNKARGYLGDDTASVPIKQAHVAITEVNGDITAAFKSGRNDIGQALIDYRDQLLDKMPDEYRAAYRQYGENKGIERAFEAGQKIFSPTLTPNQLEDDLANMTGVERKAFNKGVSKAPYDLLGRGSVNPEVALRPLRNENGYAAQKLEEVIGQDKTNDVLTTLDNLRTKQMTNAKALAGSKTAEIQEAQKRLPTSTRRSVGMPELFGWEAGAHAGKTLGGMIGYPEPGEFVGGLTGFAGGRTISPIIEQQTERAAQAARNTMAAHLSTPDPGQRMFDALKARQAYNFSPWMTGGQRKLAGAIAGAAGYGAAPMSPLLIQQAR
jgi:hypothetical protein